MDEIIVRGSVETIVQGIISGYADVGGIDIGSRDQGAESGEKIFEEGSFNFCGHASFPIGAKTNDEITLGGYRRVDVGGRILEIEQRHFHRPCLDVVGDVGCCGRNRLPQCKSGILGLGDITVVEKLKSTIELADNVEAGGGHLRVRGQTWQNGEI